jgi:AGCS family alanine or glycine:cation symporter
MFGVILMIKTFGVGSIFWVLVSGFLATSIRLSEIFMGHHYRIVSQNGKTYIGGPQIYIKEFFAQKGWTLFGKILANIFIVMLFCSTFASAQLNQTATTLRHFIPVLHDYNLLFGFVLASIIITIVSGGFRRIIIIASNTVSIMSKVYFIIAMIVIIKNYHNIMPAFSAIITDAFSLKAGVGGFLSMVIFALQRGFFCNEAGMGSGAISHSNSINKNSMQEAIIGMLTPILTTGILCMTSGLIVVVTNAHLYGETGLDIMMYALNTVHPKFHYILLIIVPSIGISAATAWAYYGQRAFSSLFGEKNIFVYNVMLFCSYIMCITATNFSAVLNLADIANLGITIPNIIALFFASKFIAKNVKEYKN